MTTVTPSSSAQNQKKPQPGKNQALFAFIVLLIINILNYADRSVLSVILPSIQKDLHLTSTESGLLGSSFLFIYALATFPLGVLADRGTRKNIIAICVGIWSVATSLAGFTQNFIQLFLARSVLGIGEAGYAPASLSMIGDLFPKGRRSRMLSIWSIGNLIGTALGLIVGGYVADTFGWRWAFYIVGIPGLIVAFLIWRAHEPKRGAFDVDDAQEDEASAEHGSLGGPGFWHTLSHIIKIPTYWVLIGAFIFSFFTIGSAQFWIPSYLVDIFHLSIKQAGTISGGVLAGGSLVGTLIGGWAADALQKRLPQGRIIITAGAFLVGAPITFIALTLHALTPFIIVFIFAIICLSLSLGPLNAIIQDIITPNIRSTAIGVVLLLAHLLGDAASPTVIGALADRVTLGRAFLITAPTCLFIAGLICLIGIKTVKKDMEAMQRHLHEQKG